MPEVSAEVFSSGEQSLLFEREDDLAAIDAALTESMAGTGGVMLIEGPAGIGKSVLLDHLRKRATERQFTVLTARGGELERGFGFGIVRQLLEVALLGADPAERARLLAGAARLAEPVFTDVSAAADTSDLAFATLHGLYWLVVNMTERGPLVLAVDDAHWADEPSLRFLLHLAHRLAGLPVTLALAVRTGSERHREDLGPLMLEARPPVLRPRPLGEAAVASLVRGEHGRERQPPALSRVCRGHGWQSVSSVRAARRVPPRRPARSTPSIRRRCTVSRPSESQQQCCCV